MKKHHSTLQKGVASGEFGAQSAEYKMSVQGIRSLSKSIGPDQAYQLSIDVRSAVTAIASNLSAMKIRLFNGRSGAEIVGGEVYDFFQKPAPGYTQSRWINELASYYCLDNEAALVRDPGKGKPKFLMPLNPGKLWIQEPARVRDLSQVTEWRYHWEDGLQALYADSQICFDKMFNPLSNIRGLSPILTGANEIGSSYEASRYNQQFFENNAVPSHLLVLPEGTPRQTRQDVENKYLSTFGLSDGNAHKVLVVSGGDVKIENLSQRPKDGEFIQLMTMNTARVAQLFKVPAIEMGIYDKARFETASVEREMFFEGTLMPLAKRISNFLQDQVVDRWFSNSSVKTAERTLSKAQRQMLDKATESAMSNIVVCLDPATTPIAAKMMKDKVAATAELRRSAGLSFNEAAEIVGLELPEATEAKTFRDMVFINNNEQRIDNLLDEPEEVVEPIAEPEVEEVVEEPVEADKAVVKSVSSFLRKYRKVAVKAADTKAMYRLSEIDALVKDDNSIDLMKLHARFDYAGLRKAIEDGDVQSVKDLFNAKDRTWIRDVAIECDVYNKNRIIKEEELND
jgi:HK97 family phage portal protein